MMIIDRIESAATRAQLAAMSALQDAAHHMTAGRGGESRADPFDPEEGATTVEYAIGTIAAAGFAGLLIVILKSDTVRAALESIIQEALNTR